MCLQPGNSCSLQMKDLHFFSTEQSVATCTNLELCRGMLPGLGYTPEEVDRLCYRRFWNNKECFAPMDWASCGGYVDDQRLELQTLAPDCSDVDPCATSSCRIQPFEHTTPDPLIILYPKCASARESASAWDEDNQAQLDRIEAKVDTLLTQCGAVSESAASKTGQP